MPRCRYQNLTRKRQPSTLPLVYWLSFIFIFLLNLVDMIDLNGVVGIQRRLRNGFQTSAGRSWRRYGRRGRRWMIVVGYLRAGRRRRTAVVGAREVADDVDQRLGRRVGFDGRRVGFDGRRRSVAVAAGRQTQVALKCLGVPARGLRRTCSVVKQFFEIFSLINQFLAVLRLFINIWNTIFEFFLKDLIDYFPREMLSLRFFKILFWVFRFRFTISRAIQLLLSHTIQVS